MKFSFCLPVLAMLVMTGAPASAQAIDGKIWRIVELAGEKLKAAEKAKTSLTFDKAATRMAGTIGCNRISATYEADSKKLTFGNAIATRMACPGDLDRREHAFMSALEKAAGYQQIGSVFVIVDAEKKKLMQLAAD